MQNLHIHWIDFALDALAQLAKKQCALAANINEELILAKRNRRRAHYPCVEIHPSITTVEWHLQLEVGKKYLRTKDLKDKRPYGPNR